MSAFNTSFRFWEEVGNAVPLAVIATDTQGIVQVWSPEAVRLYGWEPEETLGRPIQEITVGPLERGVASEIMEQVIRGQSWEGEFHARNRKGEIVRVHVVDFPIECGEQSPCGVVGISFQIDLESHVNPVEDVLSLARQIRESRRRERTRLARFMHDDIGQLLAAARTELLALNESSNLRPESSKQLNEYLDRAISRMRKEIAVLIESEVDVWEMILRCYELTRDLQARAGVLVDCFISGLPEYFQEVDESVAFAAFSVIRESLRNVERHSGSEHVEVRVLAQPEALIVTVSDDGRGLSNYREGMGLKIMRDTVEQLRGRLEVRSIEEIGFTGTVVSARIPVGVTYG